MQAARCEMMTGFLVPHRCPNPAAGTCAQCGRAYCDDHLEITPNGLLCIACKEGRTEPIDSGAAYSGYTQSDYDAFDSDEDETFIDLS